jgi:hypothetical protein
MIINNRSASSEIPVGIAAVPLAMRENRADFTDESTLHLRRALSASNSSLPRNAANAGESLTIDAPSASRDTYQPVS